MTNTNPFPSEPKVFAATVSDADGHAWQRASDEDAPSYRYWTRDDGKHGEWSDIPQPATLLFAGVTKTRPTPHRTAPETGPELANDIETAAHRAAPERDLATIGDEGYLRGLCAWCPQPRRSIQRCVPPTRQAVQPTPERSATAIARTRTARHPTNAIRATLPRGDSPCHRLAALTGHPTSPRSPTTAPVATRRSPRPTPDWSTLYAHCPQAVNHERSQGFQSHDKPTAAGVPRTMSTSNPREW